MKKLIFLYYNKKDVLIREYPIIKETNNYYIIDENSFEKIGIIKKYVGKICKHTWYSNTCEGHNLFRYPIDLPYMRDEGYFMFINEIKYKENSQYYYNIIKNNH